MAQRFTTPNASGCFASHPTTWRQRREWCAAHQSRWSRSDESCERRPLRVLTHDEDGRPVYVPEHTVHGYYRCSDCRRVFAGRPWYTVDEAEGEYLCRSCAGPWLTPDEGVELDATFDAS